MLIMGYVKDKLGADGFRELIDIINHGFEINNLKKIDAGRIPPGVQHPQTTGKICPVLGEACIEGKCIWWNDAMAACSVVRRGRIE